VSRLEAAAVPRQDDVIGAQSTLNVPGPSDPASPEDESSASASHELIPSAPSRLQSHQASLPPILHVNTKGEILLASSPALSLLRTYCNWTKASTQLPTPLRQMVSCRSDTNGSSSTHLSTQVMIGGKGGTFLLARLIEDNKRLWLLLGEHDSSRANPTHGLTRREAEVFQWLAAGKTNKDIATILAISPRTVEKHLGRIFQYLGVETRTAAAAEFYRLNQDPPSA
jgi:DNA-binding CsgD family transcriptional regulator